MAGTAVKPVRLESDSMGTIEVPADRLWGAQTQRAITHFSIGADMTPIEVIRAIAMIKQAAARTNRALGILEEEKANLIAQAAQEIIDGRWDDHFPLRVWMSGSGTQAHMNVNEVIANRAIQLAGGVVGSKSPVHPNDHVNISQSTNDVFPAAMNIAVALGLRQRLIPMVSALRNALDDKARAWADIVKIGRTHLQDAVPLTLGQEFSGYVGMLDSNRDRIESLFADLHRLAIGGTAVGTGLNAAPGFAEGVAGGIAEMTGMPFLPAPNRFAVMGAHDVMVMTSGVLKTLACSLYKIANDIRLLGSGPRCGLYELKLPENEPGSSIMPGKVNPTQCEVLTMVAVQVMGYDAAVAFAGAGGLLEINLYKPMMIFNLMQSLHMLSDACGSFTEYLVRGLEPNREKIQEYLARSLMLVTALAPVIGYDRAAAVAHRAHSAGITLKEACSELGYLSADQFDRLMDPSSMVHKEKMRPPE